MPTLEEIARFTGAELVGDGEIEIHGISSLESAGAADLAAVEDAEYLKKADASHAAAFLVGRSLDQAFHRPVLRTDFPQATLNGIIEWMGLIRPTPSPGIHETAVIGTELGQDVTVGPYAVIGAGAKIGDRCRIGAHVVIEGDVVLGDECMILHGAVIHDGARFGNRVRIGTNAVVSRQGFGYAPGATGPVALHHIGTVVLEDDVHIGAGTTIDRARFDETRIGKFSALDNLIQIGHNVRIGERTFLAAQCGLAGRARVGNDCEIGGQAGLGNNADVSDGARISGQSGVYGEIPAGTRYLGSPALPRKERLRMEATLRRLARKR